MKSKAKTQSHLKSFVAFVERQFDTKVKMIRSDNGLEFIMKQFYDKFGIIHQTSSVETPQQNVIVERKHQHLLNVTRSLLCQLNNLFSFFPPFFLTCFFLICSLFLLTLFCFLFHFFFTFLFLFL